MHNGRNRDGVAKNAEEIALLKKIARELEQKSKHDEQRVSDMNVAIENLNMNVSLTNRNVANMLEDCKFLSQFHFYPLSMSTFRPN